jgi:hypothetical protein
MLDIYEPYINPQELESTSDNPVLPKLKTRLNNAGSLEFSYDRTRGCNDLKMGLKVVE